MVGQGKEPAKPVHFATRGLDVTRALKCGAVLVRASILEKLKGRLGTSIH